MRAGELERVDGKTACSREDEGRLVDNAGRVFLRVK